MAQVMIQEHDCHHGFGDGRGAQADTGIVSALGNDFCCCASLVNGFAGHGDTGSGLQGNAGNQVLPGRNSAQRATRIILAETVCADLIAMLATALRNGRKAGAQFDECCLHAH